ncbi:HAD-IA family hydrolase [Halomonas huangheensis]|uniref:HAD family hydrolase n=1 Tax=Halomonas huangheensis TaxID=1178482 RepID=W1N2J6_9GAMM|nr:HAD-IA family hydrolase [Halomonas huangheensis]ALM52168.1 HAD family hydrolase [Halomonas huangheensis]ERL49381.1 hypothetical protein BJB45_06275 [Halomonas huangheensis]
MRYELVIFDWDGTLMDSIARIVFSMQSAARDIEWGELEAQAVRNIIGLGLPEAIAELCPGISPAQAEQLKQRYAWYFVDGSEVALNWYPGVEDGLARLASTPGMRLAVATGKSRKGLDRAFREHGIEHLFAASRTADETRSKPHPQMLVELLEELAVPARRAVMVGDTEYDLAMARALGMDGIAVGYGVHARERLLACQPVVIADDFAAVMDALLNGQAR